MTLTREQERIETWRKAIKLAWPNHGAVDILCDLARRALDPDQREANSEREQRLEVLLKQSSRMMVRLSSIIMRARLRPPLRMFSLIEKIDSAFAEQPHSEPTPIVSTLAEKAAAFEWLRDAQQWSDSVVKDALSSEPELFDAAIDADMDKATKK